MNFQKLLYLGKGFIFNSILIILFGCSNNKKVETSNLSYNFTSITEGKWMMDNATVNPPYNNETNLFSSIPFCHKDDTFVFRADSILTVKNGTLKCGNSDNVKQKKWRLINDSLLIIDGHLQRIKKISKKEMTLVYKQNVNNQLFEITQTYKNLKLKPNSMRM